MRSALLAILVLAACGTPSGAERSGCGPDWREATVVVTAPAGGEERPIPIECMHDIGVRRITIGFALPGGPDCVQLRRVLLVESADVVAVTLIGAVNDDPAAGACPDEGTMAVTEVDLAAPVGDRILLDGSGAD
jgi:hypothetical protein